MDSAWKIGDNVGVCVWSHNICVHASYYAAKCTSTPSALCSMFHHGAVVCVWECECRRLRVWTVWPVLRGFCTTWCWCVWMSPKSWTHFWSRRSHWFRHTKLISSDGASAIMKAGNGLLAYELNENTFTGKMAYYWGWNHVPYWSRGCCRAFYRICERLSLLWWIIMMTITIQGRTEDGKKSCCGWNH